MRRFTLVPLMALMLIVLAACGGSSSSSDGEIDPDGSIAVGIVFGPNTLDPHMATSELAAQFFGLWGIYDRLFTVGADGVVKGELVDDWTYSDDGNSLTLKLREDVTFRDDTPLDAAAVKVNLDRARTLESPVIKGRMSVIKDVSVASPYEVVLTLASPVPHVPAILVECAGFIMHPDLVTDGDPATETNGSGPYVLKSFVPGESLTMERDNAHYWDPEAAKIKTITYQTFPDQQAYINAVKSGELDLGRYQASQAKNFAGSSDLNIETIDQGIAVELNFNRDVKPFDNLQVRQAINYAIDRTSIVEAFFPNSTPKTQYYNEGRPGHDPAVGKIWTFDQDRAKDLLADGGFPNGVDLGVINVSSAAPPGLADVVQQQLAAVGIKSSLQTVDAGQISPQFAEGKAGSNIGFTVASTHPYNGAVYRWLVPSFNPAGATPEFSQILGAATSTATPEQQEETYKALDRFVVENAWAAPLVWEGNPWVMSKRVKGFTAEANLSPVLGPLDLRYLSVTKG